MFMNTQWTVLSQPAQVKVVVMGSSTALGSAASADSLSWVGRMQSFYRKNNADGLDTLFSVVGGYGFSTYHQMPATYTPPPGRPSYVAGFNVDQALSLFPDYVIINLPTNDINSGYTKKEQMDNLRYLRAYILTHGLPGVQCYITSTQPRNDLSAARRDSLKTLVDSITNAFGLYSINFWDDLVTNDGQNLLKDEVRHIGFPDSAYHLNDLGHHYLFLRARSKNIFASPVILPVLLKNFQVQKRNQQSLISWEAEGEEPASVYRLQRCSPGGLFNTLYIKNALVSGQPANYAWTDPHPLPGINQYRLEITGSNRTVYSAVQSISFDDINSTGITLYAPPGAAVLAAEIISSKTQNVRVCIRSSAGALIYQASKNITRPSAMITVPTGGLAAGLYYFTLVAEDGSVQTKAFIR